MNIQKFELNFESALNHFKSVFYDVNGLHDKIFEYTNFNNGNFYTYLPKSFDILKLYYFNSDILSNLNCGDMPAELQDFLFNLFSFHLYNNKKNIIFLRKLYLKKKIFLELYLISLKKYSTLLELLIMKIYIIFSQNLILLIK